MKHNGESSQYVFIIKQILFWRRKGFGIICPGVGVTDETIAICGAAIILGSVWFQLMYWE